MVLERRHRSSKPRSFSSLSWGTGQELGAAVFPTVHSRNKAGALTNL